MHTKLTIPERLKDLRVSEKRMSLQELSDATGIPSSTLGNYEKYESNFKTVKIALLIGVILGIIKIIFRLFFGMVSILFL